VDDHLALILPTGRRYAPGEARAKRLPVPAELHGLDLAPRHLALLAHLQYDGPLTVNELAGRLNSRPPRSAYEAALEKHASSGPALRQATAETETGAYRPARHRLGPIPVRYATA